MREKLLAAIEEGCQAIASLKSENALLFMEEVSALIASTFQEGGKVIIAGNGGSLCDAAHFAEELTGQFRHKRAALPAIALTEPGHLTCVANDMGFEEVFARGIEAYGKAGDLFVGLTTSGNSPNMVRAFEEARSQSLKTIAFLGKGGGALKGFCDYELLIEGFATSDRIQEAHMFAIHTIIERVEELLFREALCYA